MTNKLQHTASQEDSIEFQENTLYVFLPTIDNRELNFQRIGLITKEKISESMSIENAIFIGLLALPCFLYGIFLMKKYELTESTEKH